MKTTHNQRTYVYPITFICPDDPRQNARFAHIEQGETSRPSRDIEQAVKTHLSPYSVYRDWPVMIDCPKVVTPSMPILIALGE
jgi:hypothetical protein